MSLTPPPARSRFGIAAALLAGVLIAALAMVGFGAAPAAAGPPAVMFGYIPWPANDMRAAMASVNGGVGTTLDYTVGITNAASGSVMYYDHWEDGFEADLAIPTQSTTLVFGDNSTANGDAATFCAACTGDLLPQGAALVMRNNVATPRDATQIRFDGGDKLGSTRGFAITSGGFATNVGSLLAGVVSAYDTSIYAIDYTVPVGEDTPFPSGTSDAFSFSGLSVMASAAGTVVEIDSDADGTVDVTQTIGQGQTVYVDGGVNEGATVHASAPVQVHLATGQRGSNYESRWFTLFPDHLLSSDYMSPAGSGVGNYRTVNYLYNPSDASIDVTPTCTGCSGTITVGANASAAFHSPTNQAVRFTSAGAPFIAVAGVGAQSGAAPGGGSDDSPNWDWGFTMIPTSQLTTQVVLGWAPGNSNNPPSSPAGNRDDGTVWVTSLTATTLRVDLDGNPATGAIATSDCFGARHDLEISVTALASTRIHDSTDGDMTSARIYTCDGTVIAGAWGEDPANAPTGSPGFDAGYTIIPTTTMVVEKTAGLATDTNGDGGFSPGDVITYEIAIADAGSLAFTSVNAQDVLPVGTTYVPGSTTLDNNTTSVPIPDDVVPPAATAFPLDENGTSLPSINAGQTVYLRFDVLVVTPYLAASTILENTACVVAAEGADCDTSFTQLVSADLSLTKAQTGSPQFVGDEATFEITVTNNGPDGASAVEVTDVLPAGLSFASATAGQGSYDDATGVWAVGDLDGGDSATLGITASVEVDTPVENFAEISAAQAADPDSQPVENPLGPGDPPDQDDEDSAVVDVAPRIDLELEKAVTDGPAGDGTTEFTLTLRNRFLVDATNVTVEDYAPAGATFVSAVASVGSFDDATDVWTIADMAGDTTATLVVTYRLADLPTVNHAEVTGADQVDVDSVPAEGPLDAANPPDQDDEAAVTVDSPFADLSLSKTMTDGPDFIGDDATFEIVVTNDGPVDASGVEVIDVLPAGATIVSSSASVGAYDEGSGIWTVGDLDDGGSATLTVTATIDVAGPITNTAQVSAADQPDPDSTPANDDPLEDDQDSVSVTAPGASVGDRVWDDVDGDGFQDPSEDGLDGVTVRLLRDTDGDGAFETFVDSVVTSGDGGYSFSALPPGDYRVDVLGASLPAGVLATTAEPQDVVLAAGDVVDTVDFGYVAAASVGDQVWEDLDGDGAQDPGEPGLAGVTVTLLRDTDGDGTYETTVTSAVTAGVGGYSFAGLFPGDYRVDVDESSLPAGVLATTAEPQDVVLAAGDAVDTVDFGYRVEADLSLTKTETLGPVQVGDLSRFEITVSNRGPATATGVQVVDVLPAGLDLVTSVATQGTYDDTTGLWIVGDLAPGAAATLTIDAIVDVDTPLVNSAEVVAVDQADPDSTPDNHDPAEDDQDDALVDVAPLVDLSLSKVVTSAPTYVGEDAVFEITVTNDGPSGATGVEVADVLPAGLTFVSASAGQGAYDEVSGTWAVGDLAVGGSVSLEITARVDVPSVTNAAEVAAANEDDVDSTPGNHDPGEDDQASVGVTVAPLVDLSLTKDFATTPAHLSDTAVFSLTVVNDGPSDATGVEVTDRLPAGLTYVADDGSGAYDPATGLWTVGSVAAGGSRTIEISVTVDSLSAENFAEITAADEDDVDSAPAENPLGPGDPADQDDEDSQPVAVAPLADLSLVKTSTPAAVQQLDQAVFTITVSNDGPSEATGVEVTDLLPAGLAYVSDAPSQGSYDQATGVWTVGAVPVDGSVTLEITVRVLDAGTIVNTAEVTAANEDDPDSSPDNDDPAEDDQDSAPLSSDPTVDLSVDKSVSSPTALVGSDVTFTVSVTNDGPSAATGVAVADLLPAGLAHVSDVPSQGDYDPASGVWTVGDLAVDATATLDITVTVTGPGPIVNVAEVSAATERDVDSEPTENPLGPDDPPDQDDESSAEVVGVLIDLELSKDADVIEVNVGDDVTYTVTLTNQGPSIATGVAVAELLPQGLTFVDATPEVGTFDALAGAWIVGDIAVDETVTLQVVATVDQAGPITNTAQVSAAAEPDADSTPGNDDPSEDDQDEVTVVGQMADLSVEKHVDDTRPDLGAEVTYSLVLTNDGPSSATDIVVVDELPAGVEWVSDSSGGAYDAATGRWTVASLAAGETTTVDITVRTTASGEIVNRASVEEVDQPDPDSTPGNDDPTEDDEDSVAIEPQPASVSGIIWLDADGDGTFDADEPPIAGVVVLLLDADGELVASTVTDADGDYEFAELPPGTYTIVVDVDSLPAVVAGQTVDPDSVLDGRHQVILAAGDNVVDVDFAYIPVQDPSQPPAQTPDVTTLPRTGTETARTVPLALALIGLGGALLLLRRQGLRLQTQSSRTPGGPGQRRHRMTSV